MNGNVSWLKVKCRRLRKRCKCCHATSRTSIRREDQPFLILQEFIEAKTLLQPCNDSQMYQTEQGLRKDFLQNTKNDHVFEEDHHHGKSIVTQHEGQHGMTSIKKPRTLTWWWHPQRKQPRSQRTDTVVAQETGIQVRSRTLLFRGKHVELDSNTPYKLMKRKSNDKE